MSAPGIGPRTGAVLVFGSSAAVLVVELVALRLLAPYVGLTLEMNTTVIGIALSAIALGAWAGGRAADMMPPRRALGPLLVLSGVAVALTPSFVRLAGSAGGTVALLVGGCCLFIPAALLTAVTPMVTKLLLVDLKTTGTVVGRLSGIGTAGGIAGTVLTGFVLVSVIPVSAILIGLGVLLVVSGVLVDASLRDWRRGRRALLAGVAVGGSVAGGVAVPSGCDVETRYHCAAVEDDPERESGRTLVLDGLRHSYVDLDDPEHLEFAYIKAIASLVDTGYPAGEPLDAYHLGAGGLSIPTYLEAVRPGSVSVVSEIDPGVLELDQELLGVEPDESLRLRVEDARLGLRRLADDSRDLVVGDAFGGVSVPWHLTTREAVGDIGRVLRPEGRYAVNMIDHGELAFVRAAVSTLRAEFAHVALAAEPGAFDGTGGGNFVAVASDAPFDPAAWAARLTERGAGWRVVTGAELADWVGDAEVLTDDFAPVDQLLTPRAG
ncbi:fused MFS/spermidine synthase [Streptomyces sp. DSM 44915]|uniref:Fused MFS/spermidine synthase n=1 Tax=Streptomyces chisholmiae TaxID=3075540 RepID=A0ABU2JVS3_9ACTN|nr:fused MFS/spermidine synthase [Streptomyces sp. DSM 44915]MDT0268854.1 fused MFS/spermidine synthase [Streptomyces sp. DSM 44915]